MPRLYDWYINKVELYDGRSVLIAHGVVTGHERLHDATYINTSEVISVESNEDDVVINTRNSRYECSMKNVDYDSFEEKNLITDFELYRKKYGENKKITPEIDENTALIILGNNRYYYFDSIYVKYNGVIYGDTEPEVHVGMFQDSVLFTKFIDERHIDYRYFPYKGVKVDFYSWMDDIDTYIENCGDKELFVSVFGEVYKIYPNERKQIISENAEAKEYEFNKVDLYDVWKK